MCVVMVTTMFKSFDFIMQCSNLCCVSKIKLCVIIIIPHIPAQCHVLKSCDIYIRFQFPLV